MRRLCAGLCLCCLFAFTLEEPGVLLPKQVADIVHLARWGRDAAQMTVLATVTVFFMHREAGLLSHHPEESVAKKIVSAGIEVMKRFLGLVAEVRRT